MLISMLNVLRLYIPALQSEEGQDMAEYGILLAVIALIVVAGATLLGGNLNTMFGEVAGELGS